MTANKKAARLAPNAAFQEENTTNSTGHNALYVRARSAGIMVKDAGHGEFDVLRWGWVRRVHSTQELTAFLASQGVR